VIARTVLVVADDLGYDPAIDEGILEAHASGVVTAASALVDGRFAAPALATAPRTLAIGLHLALSPGAAEGVAEKEITRQLARFEAIRGTPPSHVDGHRHVHAEPPVLAALLRIAGPRQLRVRALDPSMRDLIRAAGARACDHFLGDAASWPFWTPERLARAAASLPGGTTEIMMHPGRRPTHVLTRFGPEREVELAAATDPRVLDAFRTAGALLRGSLPG
jgi:predicted glycoside hydrolase/deacetylase ChbG (UPF0249 family)